MIWLRTNWRLHHIRCKIRSEIYDICMLLATGYPAEIADFYPRFFWLLRRCGSLWRIRMPDSKDTCGRKPYQERKKKLRIKKISGYVWARPKAVKFPRSRTYSTPLSKSHCDEFWSQAGAGLLKAKKYSFLLHFCLVWTWFEAVTRIKLFATVRSTFFVVWSRESCWIA